MSKHKHSHASAEEDVARAEEKQELLQRLRDEALKELLSTRKGRDYYWHLLGLTGLFETSFATNALQMAKNEGERNIGLRLLTDLMRVSPDTYPLMVKEQEKENG